MDILQKIYDATDNGLNIILSYYPQALDNNGTPRKCFSIRKESAPSAYMKQIKGVWRVTDFGDSNHALSPIDIVMKEENVEFNEALSILATRYNIDTRLNDQVNKPTVEARPATDEEKDGDFSFETHPFTKEELRVLGNGVTEEHTTTLSFYALTSYTLTSNRKTTTITANENFPIFMRECHTGGESFFKILKPLEPKKEYRFIYLGSKEPDYVNGLHELRKAHAKFVAEQDNLDDEEEGKKKPTKLPECVICSGERDAICCLSRGYYPIWLNSETADLSAAAFRTLQSLCEKVCNLPDIDETGRNRAKEMALRFLDVHTILLPENLMNHRDRRGLPCKDMRDWCEFHTAPREFQKLVQTARSAKFWVEKKGKDGIRTELDVVNLLWFLELNGYARLVDPQTMKERIILVSDNNIVSEVTANKIRDFLLNHCSMKHFPLDVQRILISSRLVAGVLDALPVVNDKVKFRNHTADSQFFRFENESVEVTATEVRKCSDFHIWDTDVCRHKFKRLAPSFTYDDNGDRIDFNINDNSSAFFRFCINSSRLYWRKEFDAAREANDSAYFDDYKYSVFGHYLTDAEREEQTQCLWAKMYAIGYLLHSDKDPSMPFIVWVLENNVLGDEASSGGSGKSFIGTTIKMLKHIVNLDGRNKHLTENQHYLERVDEDTDILWLDDAVKYFDFDSFFTLATGTMIVNSKHVKSKELGFDDSPKIAITSNFAPNRFDDSTLRRLLFVPMSDYYHQKTEFNNYEETRRISDDFNQNLFGPDYTPEQWNADINFLIDCLQFFLRQKAKKQVIYADLHNIYNRINLSIMGDQFNEWAEGYFLPDGPNLDIMIKKSDVFSDFVAATGLKLWSSSKFSRALQSFVRNNAHYIECLNPPELCPASTPGRIVRKDGNRTEYYIYMKTVGTPIQERIKNSFDDPVTPI